MLKVRDIMTADVVTLAPDLSLRGAIELLADRHVSGAPVVSGGRIVGVVSTADILAFEADSPGVPEERPEMELEEWDTTSPTEWIEGEEAPGAFFSEWWADAGADLLQRFAAVRGPEWDWLGEHSVTEVMTRRLCTVSPDTDVYTAADYLTRAGVHRLLVVTGGRIDGIVSASDIVRAVAQHRLVAAEPHPPAGGPLLAIARR